MRRSVALLRGHRLRGIGLLITLALILTATGVLGAALLVLTSISFPLAGLVVTLAAVVVVPYVALVLAQFYVQLTGGPSAVPGGMIGTSVESVGQLVDGVEPVGDAAAEVRRPGEEGSADRKREELQGGSTER